MSPTYNPTLEPTKYPTKYPTRYPSPTDTLADGVVDELTSTVGDRVSIGENKLKDDSNVIIITVSISIVISVVILGYCVRKKKQSEHSLPQLELTTTANKIDKGNIEMNLSDPTQKIHLNTPRDMITTRVQGEDDVIEIISSTVNNMDQITTEGDLIHINANNSDEKPIITHNNTNKDAYVINNTSNSKTKNYNDDNLEVMYWLKEIGFGHHVGKFIVNGYHSLGMIGNIDSHQQLIDIGL
eukprot:518325_1